MATSIFSVMDGLTVDNEDIMEAELFAEQFLSSQFPTYDFRRGTALRDMTVRPNATLIAMVNKAIKHYFDDTDIINMTNDTDSDIVDSKLSNFFLTRKSGDSSVIRARLYFSFPTVTPIPTIIPSNATFSVDNDIKYSTVGNISVNPDPGVLLREEGAYYFLYDGSEELHYVDVDLKATVPNADSDIESGDLLYFTIFSPYFLQGSVQYLVSSAVPTESNEDMVERAYSSISTRNLINTPSIEAGILDQFNFVSEVYPVGLGNPNLYRDLISIARVEPELPAGTITKYHRGGHVDVYCDTPTVTQRIQFTLNADNGFTVTGPVLSMSRAPVAQLGKAEDTVPLDADFRYNSTNVSEYDELGVPVTPELDIGLSASQEITTTVAFASEGETVTMDLVTFSGLSSIQEAITSEDQRVVCADYLVRAFEPVFINVAVGMRRGDQEKAGVAAITDYIESIPSGGSIYVSSIVSALQNAGVTNFVMPIDVSASSQERYRQFDSADPGISDEIVTDITDSFDLRRTQQFYVGEITLSEVV